jgi:hypothetical protein
MMVRQAHQPHLVCHYRSLNAGSPVQGTVFSYRFIERHQSDVIEKILIFKLLSGYELVKNACLSNDFRASPVQNQKKQLPINVGLLEAAEIGQLGV